MTVRPLDFLDLPFLARYRQSILPLDSAHALTRGNPIRTTAFLSYLDRRQRIYTAVASQDGNTLIGQILLVEDELFARSIFLAPQENIETLFLPLIDHLVIQAGKWGALHLLAEVDEDSPAFRLLRQAGFAMYASQRIWKLSVPKSQHQGPDWDAANDMDWPVIQSLRNQIIPALLQPLETPLRIGEGLVCRGENNLLAYAAVSSGPRGIWLQPFVPPDSGCDAQRLLGLSRAVGGSEKHPVYVCVRSYQAWLETALEEAGAKAGPRQAVLARRLAKMQKVEERLSTVRSKVVSIQPSGMGHITEHKIKEHCLH